MSIDKIIDYIHNYGHGDLSIFRINGDWLAFDGLAVFCPTIKDLLVQYTEYAQPTLNEALNDINITKATCALRNRCREFVNERKETK